MSQGIIVMIVGLCILNGIFSPALVMVFALHGIWYPFLLPAMLPLVFLLSSLILSTLTLMASGVPAALYERLMSEGRPSQISGLIWLAGALLLTLPAVPNVLQALSLGG
jgi:hypothetical protein